MTPLPSALPTAPLPPAARDALRRLELALDPAARLQAVAAECRRRSAAAVTVEDFDRLLCVQDELAMCRCQLAAAGRLHLIGGVMAEHEKTKDPLPQRPRGPHPHRTGVAA